MVKSKIIVICARSNNKRITFKIVVLTIGLSGMPDKKGVARKYFRHCSVGTIQDGRHLSKVEQNIHITFNRMKL